MKFKLSLLQKCIFRAIFIGCKPFINLCFISLLLMVSKAEEASRNILWHILFLCPFYRFKMVSKPAFLRQVKHVPYRNHWHTFKTFFFKDLFKLFYRVFLLVIWCFNHLLVISFYSQNICILFNGYLFVRMYLLLLFGSFPVAVSSDNVSCGPLICNTHPSSVD